MNSTKRRRQSGRLTPYSTQRRDRDASPDIMSEQPPTADQLEVISDLLSKTWQFHHVSPLWKLDTSFAKLRSYSQLLTKHMNDSIEQGLHQTSGSVQYIAKVAALPRFGQDGSESLKITVRHKSSSRETPELMAVLCRVNASQSLAEGFTSLPLLLLHGAAKLSRVTFLWLQAMFDCHVSPNKLSTEDLTQLVAAYATAEKVGRGLGSVELVYSLPEPVKKAGLSTISVELSYDSALMLWNSTSHTEGKSDRRKEFVKTLSDHVHDHLHIKLESMTLSRISTPVLHAEAEGRLKFSSVNCVIPVLSVLQYRHP